MARHKDETIGLNLLVAPTDRYPEPRQAVPMNFLHLSRTSKIITPGIVLVTILILLVASIAGIFIAIPIFDSKIPHKLGIKVAQVFVLIVVNLPDSMRRVRGC